MCVDVWISPPPPTSHCRRRWEKVTLFASLVALSVERKEETKMNYASGLIVAQMIFNKATSTPYPYHYRCCCSELFFVCLDSFPSEHGEVFFSVLFSRLFLFFKVISKEGTLPKNPDKAELPSLQCVTHANCYLNKKSVRCWFVAGCR